MTNAWRQGTLATYGSGLLHYHVFCDLKNYPESSRAPASPMIISAFLASLAGRYSASTIENYVAGVRAWHILHNVKWEMNKATIDAMLKAATALAPAASTRAPRTPLTVQTIESIAPYFDLTKPLDVATFACLTTAFWGMARLGEFVVPKLSGFDPQSTVTRENMEEQVYRDGLMQTVFHLPRTKAAPQGEDIYWAAQDGPSNPQRALRSHLSVNHSPPPSTPLFAYKDKQAWKPLSRANFLKRLNSAIEAANLLRVHGHSIRIGAVLEYLLRGVPFDVVKVKGRWASDVFLVYLREYAQILAPYMQANSHALDNVIRITMPPIVRH